MGTRFLPATKANPKEMLPIVDKPLIQYAAEEAVAAGITELIFITGRTKRSITDHFDKAYELAKIIVLLRVIRKYFHFSKDRRIYPTSQAILLNE